MSPALLLTDGAGAGGRARAVAAGGGDTGTPKRAAISAAFAVAEMTLVPTVGDSSSRNVWNWWLNEVVW